MISIKKVNSEEELQAVFKIREIVFIQEQKVNPQEEYDEFETSSFHFLAQVDGKPAGTARWRLTDQGIKLERFAVISSLRGRGVGHELVKAVLKDIKTHYPTEAKTTYLHAQLTAVSLYEKHGFNKEGEIFMECNIPHYRMKKNH